MAPALGTRYDGGVQGLPPSLLFQVPGPEGPAQSGLRALEPLPGGAEWGGELS